LTSADGTTFIISYEYVNEGDLNNNNINADLTNKVLPPEDEVQLVDNANRDFLEGFLSGKDCLTGGSGWWRFEIWYGKHVIQFHVKNFFILRKNKRLFFKDEGQQRTSVLLGTWNLDKHIEWINANPKKRYTGNVKERQYEIL
jgi:hypothetical protein